MKLFLDTVTIFWKVDWAPLLKDATTLVKTHCNVFSRPFEEAYHHLREPLLIGHLICTGGMWLHRRFEGSLGTVFKVTLTSAELKCPYDSPPIKWNPVESGSQFLTKMQLKMAHWVDTCPIEVSLIAEYIFDIDIFGHWNDSWICVFHPCGWGQLQWRRLWRIFWNYYFSFN